MNKKENNNIEKKNKKPKLDKGRIITKAIALSMVVILMLGFAGTLIFYLLNS